MITVDMIPKERIRQMAVNAMKRGGKSGHFTSMQVDAFLSIHGDALEDKINNAVRDFVFARLVGNSVEED